MRFAVYILGFGLLFSTSAIALEDRKAHFTVSYHMGEKPRSKLDLHQRGLDYVKKFLVGLEQSENHVAPEYQQSTIVITTSLPAAFCELYASKCLPRRVMLYNNIVRIEGWDGTTSYYKDSKKLAEALWQQGDPLYLKKLEAPQ